MALSATDVKRVLFHLGYPVTNPVETLGLGMPLDLYPAWRVERAVEHLAEADGTYDRLRSILQKMDNIEKLLEESQVRRAVLRAEELTLNEKEAEQLEGEYRRWGMRMADMLGVEPYKRSERYKIGWGLSGRVRSVPTVLA